MLASACDRRSGDGTPTGGGPDAAGAAKPVLIHTGAGLVAWPGESVSESVYVADTAQGGWRIELVAGPPGTGLAGRTLTYDIPEGLSGPQTVRVRASRDASAFDSAWTIEARPSPNAPPVLEDLQPPEWMVSGVEFLRILRASDPDGDSLRFRGTLPDGAGLRGNELDWVPGREQAGRQSFHLEVEDGHGHSDSLDFSIEVLGFDPWPYTAEPRPKRIWRIRGYAVSGKGDADSALDSVGISRTVALSASLRENSSFTFRVTDTLGGDAEGIRDTSYSVFFQEGSRFEVAGVQGLIPFAWPANAARVESLQVSLGDSVFAARKEIDGEPCPESGQAPMAACRWSERIFATGWGLVSFRSGSRDPETAEIRREAYEVWSVSGP